MQKIPPSPEPPSDVLRKLQQDYTNTIPEKMSALRTQCALIKHSMNEETLMMFRKTVHKIAGSAGTYGYPEVSQLCVQCEKKLIEKMEYLKNGQVNKEWIQEFEGFIEKVQENFSHQNKS